MKRKILAIWIAAALLLSVVPVGAESLRLAESPAENVFYVGEKSFVLLEENSEQEGCLVIARNFYGEKTYNGPVGVWNQMKQKFDPTEENSLAQWLNSDETGGFLKDGGLPDGMSDYLIAHSWVTEGGHPKGNSPSEYQVNAKVVIPSVEELVKYAHKIGYADEFFNEGYADKAGGSWWTRSGFPFNWPNYEFFVRTVHTDNSNRQAGAFGCWNGGELAVRPMFYLSWDFFKNAAIDLERSGENVLAFLKKFCTEEELRALYGEEQVLGLKENIAVTDEWTVQSLRPDGYLLDRAETGGSIVLQMENIGDDTVQVFQRISGEKAKYAKKCTVTFRYRASGNKSKNDVVFTARGSNGEFEPYYLYRNQWSNAKVTVELQQGANTDIELAFHLNAGGVKLEISDFSVLSDNGEQLACNPQWNSGAASVPPVKRIHSKIQSDGSLYFTFEKPHSYVPYLNLTVYNERGEKIACANTAIGELYVAKEHSGNLNVYSEDVGGKRCLVTSVAGGDIDSDSFYPYSSQAYTFRIEGSEQEFLLLDVTGDTKSKFFVMAKDFYARRAFDSEGGCGFMDGDESGLAYWLNHTFLSESYDGKKLPEQICAHLDREHIWSIQEQSGTYTQQMPLAIPSAEEMRFYRDKIGVVDDIYNNGADLWWLRTSAADSVKNISVMNTATPAAWNKINSWVTTGSGAVRPVFYLDRNFFKQVRLDLAKTGAGVLSEIAKEFDENEWESNYSAEEISEFKERIQEPFLVNYVYLTEDNRFVAEDTEAANLLLRIKGGLQCAETNAYTASYAMDDALLSATHTKVEVLPFQERQLLLRSAAEGGESVRGFWWNKDGVPLCDVLLVQSPITKAKLSRAKTVNVFTDKEPLRFRLKANPKKELCYIIRDFWDKKVEEGHFFPEKSEYEWRPEFSGYGYFSIDIAYADDPDVILTSSIFCIVTDEDFSTEEESVFGINAHMNHVSYGWNPELIDYMAIMGAKTVRVDYSWAYVEKEKGKYTIAERAHIDKIRAHNMNINFVSGYANRFYDNGYVPYTQEGVDGFVKYQDAVLKMLGDTVTELDVYNEFWGGFGSSYGGPAQSKPEYYYSILKATYEQLKPKYPNVKFLATAVMGERKTWYENLLAMGGGDYADGIYHHSYYTFDEVSPETAIPSEYQDFITANNSAAVDKPIYLTESGASNYSGGVSEKEQASRLVRSYVLWMKNGAVRDYWYDFMDDGTKETELEHNFGMIRSVYHPLAYTPKPAYVAYAVLARQLKGMMYDSFRQYGEDIYCVTFLNGEERVNVVWSLCEQNVTVTTSEEMCVTDMMGNETSGGNTQSLRLCSEPIYITGEIQSLQ